MQNLQRWRPYVEADAHEGGWDVLALYGSGRPDAAALAGCPATARALAAVPDMQQALFSCLAPGARIAPHAGAPGIARVHLGLFAEPGRSGWRVGGQERLCVAGEVVAFEDGCVHEAWNESEQPRVTLLFDTLVPYLSASQREAVRAQYRALMDAGRAHALK
jgi:beta-hydroxylase